MTEELEKKISKRKEKKKLKKQEQDLNILSEGKWRRLGAFASWSGYRVDIKGRQEVVPVRKNASKISLINITNNLKQYIRRKKQLEAEQKKQKKVHKRKNQKKYKQNS